MTNTSNSEIEIITPSLVPEESLSLSASRTLSSTDMTSMCATENNNFQSETVLEQPKDVIMTASGGTGDLRQTALTCRGHTRPVTHLAFSDVTPDGYFLASACKDGKAMLRMGSTGDWIGTLEKHKGAVFGICINDMATRAVTASADHTVKIWDLLNGNELHQLEHRGIVKSVALSKSSNRLVTCGQDKNIMMYRLDHLSKKSPEEFEGAEVGSRNVIFGETERTIYVASEDGGLMVTDIRTERVVLTKTFADVIKDMRLNPEKNSVILCHGLQADVFDIRSQGISKSFKINAGVLTADYHPTDPCVTLGCDDHRLYKFSLYDTENFEINRGHFGPIHCARFSPDGELIASGSEDGTVRLWQYNVGKTYGLWKGISNNNNNGQHVSSSLSRNSLSNPTDIPPPYKETLEEAFEEEDEESSTSLHLEEMTSNNSCNNIPSNSECIEENLSKLKVNGESVNKPPLDTIANTDAYGDVPLANNRPHMGSIAEESVPSNTVSEENKANNVSS